MATSFGFRQFAERMNAIAKKFGDNASETVRRAAIAADYVAVNATPVDTGRARANWRVGIGNPVLTYNEDDFDQGGGATVRNNESVISLWEVGKGPIFISNNVPYIVPLDRGSSAQAPSGMSSLAIQAARAQLGSARLLEGV